MMIWLMILVIILILYFEKKREKFSNPPTDNDIDFMKNYIKASKYSLNQISKKLNPTDLNAKFTTANAILSSVDNKINELTNKITELQTLQTNYDNLQINYNNLQTNYNNVNNSLTQFYDTYTTSLVNFVSELLNNIINYNNILMFPSDVISTYVESVSYIGRQNTNELKFMTTLKILNNIKTDIIKVVFGKLIHTNNNIISLINLLSTDFSSQLNDNEITSISSIDFSIPQSGISDTVLPTYNDINDSNYYKINLTNISTGNSLPRIK
jgi:hypothetical protein